MVMSTLVLVVLSREKFQREVHPGVDFRNLQPGCSLSGGQRMHFVCSTWTHRELCTRSLVYQVGCAAATKKVGRNFSDRKILDSWIKKFCSSWKIIRAWWCSKRRISREGEEKKKPPKNPIYYIYPASGFLIRDFVSTAKDNLPTTPRRRRP